MAPKEKASERDKQIGDRILSLLPEKVTAKEFSIKAGISPSHFQKLLRGQRRWKIEYLDKVIDGFRAYGLDVTYDQLLQQDSEKHLLRILEAPIKAATKDNGGFKQKILQNTALIIEELNKREREKLALEMKLNLIKDAFSKESRPARERRKIYSLMKDILKIE